MDLKILMFIWYFASAVSGCHWFRSEERKKRSASSEVESSEVWRTYFAVCMESKVSCDPTLNGNTDKYDWQSNVDFTILDSIWYINVDQWLCSSAAHEDTVACWQKQLENFLSVDTAVYRYGNECIAEFGEDTEETPPLLRYLSRKKRQLSGSYTSGQHILSSMSSLLGYSSCIGSKMFSTAERKTMDFMKLTNFIKDFAIYGCEACGVRSRSDEDSPMKSQTPEWPHRFLNMTRTDSPMKNAIAECNDDYFPRAPFWSAWTQYIPTCPGCGRDRIYQTRSRTCRSGVDPSREESSSKCTGPDIEQKKCPYVSTPCITSWTSWQPWASDCPICGDDAIRKRIRICRNQFKEQLPANQCTGSPEQTENCHVPSCRNPRTTFWGEWGPWDRECPTCYKTEIYQKRKRYCFSRFFSVLGSNLCPGTGEQQRLCPSAPPCLAMAWSQWSQWTPCGSSCRRYRVRSCLEQNKCKGYGQKYEPCFGRLCSRSRLVMWVLLLWPRVFSEGNVGTNVMVGNSSSVDLPVPSVFSSPN